MSLGICAGVALLTGDLFYKTLSENCFIHLIEFDNKYRKNNVPKSMKFLKNRTRNPL